MRCCRGVGKAITYHQEWSHDPIQHDAKANLDPQLLGAERKVKRFIFDLAQDRVHHDQKSHS